MSKYIFYGLWEALKVGRVTYFLLRFASKLIAIFDSLKEDKVFFVVIKIHRIQKLKQKTKPAPNFYLQKELEP